ncbi:MAG TPA: MlaD family protein [Ignavibacteria bacterium]
MEKKSHNIKLGVFVALGLLFFIVAMYYVGSKQNLFSSTFVIRSYFKSVGGLVEGNTVRFSGISVGNVQKIEVVGTDKVVVEMVIQSKIQKFIKKDAEVIIGSEGLVGNKMISISAGTEKSSSVEDGDFLNSVVPVEIGDILENLNNSTKDAQTITKELTDIVAKVNKGEGTLGQLVNNNSLYNSVDSLFRNFAKASGNLNNLMTQVGNSINTLSAGVNDITKNIGQITEKLNSPSSFVGTILTDTTLANNLKQTIENANATTKSLERGAFSLYQNMEALKHNFLFKGYFEDIGYWDKEDYEKTLDEYDKRLLEMKKQVEDKQNELKRIQQQLDSVSTKINN